MGDVSGRRGKIMGMDSEGKFQIIRAQIPLAELYKYSTNLGMLDLVAALEWVRDNFEYFG